MLDLWRLLMLALYLLRDILFFDGATGVCKGKKLPGSPVIPPSLPFKTPQPQQ
jgi:hypothetical protein